jgi:hypothetical protein
MVIRKRTNGRPGVIERCPPSRQRFHPTLSEGVEAARSLVEAQPKAVDAIRSRVSLALLYGDKMRRAGSFRCPQLRFVRQQPPCIGSEATLYGKMDYAYAYAIVASC